jgi:hypothetical protein
MDREVVTREGTSLGRVHEALLVQDGPILSEAAAAFRVHGLAVGPRRFGMQLGYFQGTVTAPALLRRLILRRRPTTIPWRAIVSLEEERIVVDEQLIGATPAG